MTLKAQASLALHCYLDIYHSVSLDFLYCPELEQEFKFKSKFNVFIITYKTDMKGKSGDKKDVKMNFKKAFCLNFLSIEADLKFIFDTLSLYQCVQRPSHTLLYKSAAG